MTTNHYNYERDGSHEHCWDQKGPPACGLKVIHLVCCLCGHTPSSKGYFFSTSGSGPTMPLKGVESDGTLRVDPEELKKAIATLLKEERQKGYTEGLVEKEKELHLCYQAGHTVAVEEFKKALNDSGVLIESLGEVDGLLTFGVDVKEGTEVRVFDPQKLETLLSTLTSK